MKSCLLILLALATTSSFAQSDLPTFYSYKDVASAGYMTFNGVKGLAFFEARTGQQVADEQYVAADDALLGITDEPTKQLFYDARGVDQFKRREGLNGLAPLFDSYRAKAKEAKGLLVSLPSRKGNYDFNLQAFQMEGAPKGGPAQKYYGGGLVCSDNVDKLTPSGRSFCVYLSNFNDKGRYMLPLGEQDARQFSQQWDRGELRVFALGEFEGPPQVSQPKSAAAATQAIQVKALVIVNNATGYVFKTVPVHAARLPNLSNAPALNSGADAGRSSTTAQPSQTSSKPSSTRLTPVPLKSKTASSGDKAGKPVIVDVRE